MRHREVVLIKTNNYTAFGLAIDSQISLPELNIGKGKAEVRIFDGEVYFDDENIGATYRISQNEFSFRIKNVAKYLIKNGTDIVVEVDKLADQQTLRVYLLGTAMGMLLIQKEIIPIHGSAVVVDGSALILTGNCGAGKTTLSSWFQKSGYGYLADDISAIRIDSKNVPIVYPAFARQRLNKDSALQLGLDIDGLSPCCSHDDKFDVNVPSSLVIDPMPLVSIVRIEEDETQNVRIEKITGIDKIHNLIGNIYCAILYEEIGFSKSFFSKCMEIVKHISMYRLIRPKGIFTAEEQMNLVLETVYGKVN